jgi:hypothetical protein
MKAKRLEHPFEHSLYKLKEVAAGFEAAKENIRRIARYKKGECTKHDLRSCTSEDIHIYLRKAPNHMAWDLGYHIIYGIDGLKGDGVSAETIKNLKKDYLPRIDKLIDECDKVSDLIRTNISREYENFKRDESDIFELFDEALIITDSILDDAGYPRVVSLYG